MEKDFYFEFENKFRGSRDEIKNRLSNYQGLLDYILLEFDTPKLLDIGCGRGEWLEICNNQGIKSLGIESDSSMYDFCKGLNLDVFCEDALTALFKYEKNSFQLISAFHLIEHLDNRNLDILLNECQRILEPGGVLILETPSIDNIKVSTKSFYLDPTHINPIHPEGLIYRLESIGFDQIKYYLINGAKLFKPKFNSLSEVLDSVAQDVVFIGTIHNNKNSNLFSNEDLWKDKFNSAIGTIQAFNLFDERVLSIEKKIEFNNELYVNQINNLNNLNNQINNLNNQINNLNNQLNNEINNLRKNIEFLLFRQNKLFNSLPFKIIRILKLSIKFFLMIIKSSLRFFIHGSFQIISSTLSEENTIIFYRLVAKFFKFIGKDILARKILSKIIKIDKIDCKSNSLNDMLLGYYDYSIKAKEIYRDFK